MTEKAKRFQMLVETAHACRDENLAAQRRWAAAERGSNAARLAAEDCDYWNEAYHATWTRAMAVLA